MIESAKDTTGVLTEIQDIGVPEVYAIRDASGISDVNPKLFITGELLLHHFRSVN